jgi:hypothetical protein
MAYTIDISDSNLTFEAINPSKQTITVTTNGKTDSVCYDIMTDIEWVSIERSTGTVTIIPSSDNRFNHERDGYIVFYNRADHSVYKILNIVQKNIEYKIVANETNIKCPSFQKEMKIIKVSVYGGKKRFYINTISEYKNGNRIVYDKALNVLITPTPVEEHGDYNIYEMIIETYGVLDVISEYEIILSHTDARDVQLNIKVSFDNVVLSDAPVIVFDEHTYCDKTKIANRLKANTFLLRRNAIVTPKIEEYINIECMGILNPDIIDITDGDIKIKVYTQINNNGNKETDSDVYARLSVGWVGVEYLKAEYTNEYKVLRIYPIKNNDLYIDRKCGLIIYNMERKNIHKEITLLQKGKERK